MKPEAGQVVYWTNVSRNTKVRIAHIAKKWRVPYTNCLQNRASPIPSSNCRAGLPLERIPRKACEARTPSAEFTIYWPGSWETEDITSRVRTNRNEEKSARNRPRFEAERQRVCRMPGVAGRLVVSPTPVRGVRAHRMLRQFSEPACIQACRGDGAFNYCQLRAG